MFTKQKGFTLIEVMVTVVIVAVLVAIALPMYQNYRVRAVVSEALVFAEEQRIRVEEYYESTSQMPQDAAQAGITQYPGIHLISQVRWNPGVVGQPSIDKAKVGQLSIVMDLRDYGYDGEYIFTLVLVAEAKSGGQLHWRCTNAWPNAPRVEDKHLPHSCRGN